MFNLNPAGRHLLQWLVNKRDMQNSKERKVIFPFSCVGEECKEYHLHLLCTLEKTGSLENPILKNNYTSQEYKS